MKNRTRRKRITKICNNGEGDAHNGWAARLKLMSHIARVSQCHLAERLSSCMRLERMPAQIKRSFSGWRILIDGVSGEPRVDPSTCPFGLGATAGMSVFPSLAVLAYFLAPTPAGFEQEARNRWHHAAQTPGDHLTLFNFRDCGLRSRHVVGWRYGPERVAVVPSNAFVQLPIGDSVDYRRWIQSTLHPSTRMIDWKKVCCAVKILEKDIAVTRKGIACSRIAV